MNSLLHCEGLSKRFGGLQAVQQVGFLDLPLAAV